MRKVEDVETTRSPFSASSEIDLQSNWYKLGRSFR
ncbi:unnamed protein product [Soboliphyme baturini]|uniref:Uncharacterized protein n=1 Tax=Soboliphyme baturini TaxID=241478 RepID=A0A183J4G4_9BILA|nr:unnamed protein product [Soboliphyme baturini]